MPATGARRGHLVYHWKHGWIPLDHFAALSKAKGSHKGAAKIMEKHGISAPSKPGSKAKNPMNALTDGTKYRETPAGIIAVRGQREVHLLGTSVNARKRAHEMLAGQSFDRLFRSGRSGPGMKHVAFHKLEAPKPGKAEHGLGSSPGLDHALVQDLRGGSADKHLVTDASGTRFSAERAALHADIINRIVGGHKSQKAPAFVMLGGGPASGKTKAAEAAAKDFPSAVTINPDDIKAMLPEYKQLGPDKAAAFTHEESSYLAKQATAAAIAQRSHIILDAVGDNSEKSVMGKVTAAKAAGYSTHARYVTVPTHVAQTRAVMRGQKSGRVVPPTVIAHAHSGVSDVFPKVMGHFDTASLHDNNTAWKPVLTTSRGRSPTIHDPAAWHAFLQKAKG